MSITLSNINGLTMNFGGQPFDNIITGGQPSPEDMKMLKDAGLDNIINMRNPGEQTDFNDLEAATAAGLTYIAMPIAGEAGITLDNAKQLDDCLKELKGNTLVHCATSNRVGALFAIRSAVLQGNSLEQALSEGQAAGLKGLTEKATQVINSQQ